MSFPFIGGKIEFGPQEMAIQALMLISWPHTPASNSAEKDNKMLEGLKKPQDMPVLEVFKGPEPKWTCDNCTLNRLDPSYYYRSEF